MANNDNKNIEVTLTKKSKRLSNAFSTGNGGGHFESHVQASFVVLMLTGGFAPALPSWPIKEVKLQGKIAGFDTDDLIVTVENSEATEHCKLLGQVKHSIAITRNNSTFSEVIQAAWNDFNNQEIFRRDNDVIALITGPLNATDAHGVQWLLGQARHTASADEFYRNVEQAYFSPSNSSEKLKVIQHHLKLANSGVDVADEEVYSFLNHFHLLGYDLGKETGVILSLLNSHISQFIQENPEFVWGRIVDVVQTWNQDAGTIRYEKLPKELIKAFQQRVPARIPAELAVTQSEQINTNWRMYKHAVEIAVANLAGAWTDTNDIDQETLSKLAGQSYISFVGKSREILHLPDSPLSLRNGIWEIRDRADLWDTLGPYLFDQHLEIFKDLTISILTERDPIFSLPADKRYAGSLDGNVLLHSRPIRKGVAEGLALLGSRPNALSNASVGRADLIATLTLREIFKNADWVLWGSLNDLLPTLAEASPDEFLDVVENALSLSPSPFDELFSQEGRGITGQNYLTGLLFALEGLAWDEKCLVRVCVILGALASHDPGGQWANRPGNSLATILLPWLPQTTASIAKRRVAATTLQREYPEIAWKLLLKLLPSNHQTSVGSHKPQWRKIIPDGWNKTISREEYWEQVSFYADSAISMSENDIVKLVQIIGYFDRLPKSSYDRLVAILTSKTGDSLSETNRRDIWEALTKLIARHQRFSDAKWAMGEDLLSPLLTIAQKFAPSDPFNLHQHLFSDRNIDLYEERGNWAEQEEKLRLRRQAATAEIFEKDGIQAVVSFLNNIENSRELGQALGALADSTVDKELLPNSLDSDNRKRSNFISAYIWARYINEGWSWVDLIDKSSWEPRQIGLFLAALPFTKGTWDRATKWLPNDEDEYWSLTNANFYNVNDDFGYAIGQLVKYGRPHVAINGLYGRYLDKQIIDLKQCVDVLLAAAKSSESSSSIDEYQIVELIKMLQNTLPSASEDLALLEWTYLPLLDPHNHGSEASPKELERRLANDPLFFCELIRQIYRSDKVDPTQETVTEEMKTIATRAWQLLERWTTPPGMGADGTFDGTKFLVWLETVKEACSNSGHLDIAFEKIGKILVHCPPDQDGFWINRTAADVLNALDAKGLRTAFSLGVFNSRGAHWVDPSGKAELQLAEQYNQKAEVTENAGYHRFATMLRELVEYHTHEAKRIIARYKAEEK